MNKNQRSLTFASLILLFLFAGTTNVDAVEQVKKVHQKEYLNSVEAQGSFNYARREIFRELYGNGLTLALRYERVKNDKIGWGVHLSRVQLCNARENAITKLKYREYAIAPLLTYSLVKTGSLRLFGGAGPGLSFRKVTLESVQTNEVGEVLFAFEASQTEITPFVLLMSGADLNLSRSTFLGARITYHRQFLDSVETGDFGDTGGFNFGGSFGFRF